MSFPYTEPNKEITSSFGSFKGGSSNSDESVMRAFREGGDTAFSTGGGSSGEAISFPFPLEVVGTTQWGHASRPSTTSPRNGGRSFSLGTPTGLQRRTSFIWGCCGSSLSGLSRILHWLRDKGSSLSLGRPLESRWLPHLGHTLSL